jgi:hypothetical protein
VPIGSNFMITLFSLFLGWEKMGNDAHDGKRPMRGCDLQDSEWSANKK